MRTKRQATVNRLPLPGEDSTADATVVAQLAALQRLSVNELKQKWGFVSRTVRVCFVFLVVVMMMVFWGGSPPPPRLSFNANPNTHTHTHTHKQKQQKQSPARR